MKNSDDNKEEIESNITECAENEDESTPTCDDEPKKKFSLRDFLRDNGIVIIALCAVLLLGVIVLLAVILKGDLCDKAAFFWILAFLAELAYYKFARKSRGTLAALIVTAALAVGFVALYGLELGGII